MQQHIYKIILLFSLIVTLHAKGLQRVEKFDNMDGTQRIRVYFNYLDKNSVSKRLHGIDGKLNLDLPIPNKWELLNVSGYIKYNTSLLILKEHSSGTLLLNDIIIKQFKLFDHAGIGIKFEIDPLLFGEYNQLTFQSIQHYTTQCEDPSSNQLWTDIDLKESYIDFIVRPRPVREEIASFKTALFDQKQYTVTPLNFVISDMSNKALKNYALFTSVASTHLKYRIEQIKASSKIDKNSHNAIIASKEKARQILKSLDDFYLFDQKPAFALHFNQNNCKRSEKNEQKGLSILQDDGLFEAYMHFDGGQLKIPAYHSMQSEQKTIAFWMRSDKQKHTEFLFGTDTYALALSENTVGFVNNTTTQMQAEISLRDGHWHYITAVVSDSGIKNNQLYIDGKKIELVETDSHNTLNMQNETYFAIGGSSDNKEAFHGDIDQLYLFDSALSDAFIQKLYKVSDYHREHDMNGILFIDEKIAHDINIIQNPYNVENAIVVIAPDDSGKIEQSIAALYKDDLLLYKRAGLDINQTIVPSPALPYTAKKFVPLNKKIYFKELGYRTKLLKGQFPPRITLDFKVYPDNYFDSKDKIDLNLHYVFPMVVHPDSVANIYLNGNFAKQIDIKSNAKESRINVEANKLFDWDSLIDMPAYLIGQGFNRLQFEFSLIPEKKNHCEIFNTENLVATVLDNSYFVIPKAKKWIEMPYLQLIANSAYPYSIYPDLQQTTVLLANKNYETIAASMNFIFYLTQQIDSYPYYLNISDTLDEKTKASQIIAFGTIDDPLMEEISQNAPVTLNKDTLTKRYPFVENFIEHKGILDASKNKKYLFRQKISEGKSLDRNLIFQMSRSPYDKKKTIVMAIAENSDCLNKGLFSLLQQQNRGKIKGDLLIYDYQSEAARSFDVKDKYIISNLNWIDTASLIIGRNPVLYIVSAFLILLMITYLLRQYLLKFKEDHHKNAE